ncbi:uncharacterized protein LOC123720519 isoform X1 [Pieris brassicae]|uniref:uncharacterized protein LOC123720519 isoform X1 n=1 Tax=Pieris brassicae TaxID=7116 RepID=UPI001E660EFF|nr:uncharacterized protein LOC123720519 isoform X1 [Pieris brassicae]
MYSANKSVVLRLAIFFLTTQGVLCLRNAHMIIPEAVERGKTAVIKCIFELENEDLYQVKWYRNDEEFCRYAPRDVPPLKVFPVHGIEVVQEESDVETLTIKATKEARGLYTCEVSADAPSFFTLQVHGTLNIVDLPKSDPELNGLKRYYRPGMKLKAECISYDSMPAANLTFYINNEQAISHHVWSRVGSGENGDLWTAYSTMQYVVQKHHFVRGKIKIRCSAAIYSIYFRSHERVVEEEGAINTIAPLPETKEAIVFPINRISFKNGSVNGGMSYSTEYREVGILLIFTYVIK